MKAFIKKSFFQSLIFLNLIVVFISCKGNKEKVITEEKFIKEWQSKKIVIPHTAYLKIKPDYTFEYKDAGCQWRCNSFGNWKVVNDTLILSSIPSKECQIMDGFVSNIKFLKKGETYEPETTIKGCKPDQGKEFYINFKNDKFYLKNDTLEYVTNIKLPFNDRIAFFKKQ